MGLTHRSPVKDVSQVSKNKKEQKSLKNLSNFKKSLFPTSKPESTSRICGRQSIQEKKKSQNPFFEAIFLSDRQPGNHPVKNCKRQERTIPCCLGTSVWFQASGALQDRKILSPPQSYKKALDEKSRPI